MTIRQQFGLLYRACFKSIRFIGLQRLPVRCNGMWSFVPIDMWDGFRSDYEPYLITAFSECLKPGDTFIDVGAHFGIWSAFASKLVGPIGRVIACEPSPAFKVLQSHIGDRANVRLRNVVVGATEGNVVFHAQGFSTSGSMHPDVTDINRYYLQHVPVTKINVPMISLDQLVVAEGAHPSLIKIDVEGFEHEVLRGATRLLTAGANFIIEIHPPQLNIFCSSAEDVVHMLESFSYRIDIIYQRTPNSLYTILATKHS